MSFHLFETDRMLLSQIARCFTREYYENLLKKIEEYENENFYTFNLRFVCHEWLTHHES